VGRIDRPLTAPTKPWQVASVAFEIARRHRFAREMSEVPANVEVHLLPTGADEAPRPADLSSLRYRDFSAVPQRIAAARAATAAYLAGAPDRPRPRG
jgi:NTE family protein